MKQNVKVKNPYFCFGFGLLFIQLKNRWNMKIKIFLALAVVSLGAYSCVSPKKLQEAENKYTQLNGAYAELQGKYRDVQDEIAKAKAEQDKNAFKSKSLQSTIDDLNKQIDFLKVDCEGGEYAVFNGCGLI